MDATRRYIKNVLAQAKNPSLLVSFGKDSLLLLHLVREIKPNISIFWFGDKLSRFAESVIKDNDLQVYSYAPADRYLVPNGDGYSLIDEYSFGQSRVPLVSDLFKSDLCELNLPAIRTPLFNWQSDITFWGGKATDSHPLIGHLPAKEFQLGDTKMVAPLWTYSDEDVFECLEAMAIPYEPETNDIPVCQACLDEIEATMDREASLGAFRGRFQFGEGH